MLKSDKVAL